MTIRLVLAGGSTMTRRGISHILGGVEDIGLVSEVEDTDEWLHKTVVESNPDVLVYCCRAVERDRQVITDKIAGLTDGSKLLVLLIMPAEHGLDISQAVRAGIDGCMHEDDGPEDLVNAIRALVSGRAWLSPAAARELVEHYRSNTVERVIPTPEGETLSPREQSVVRLVAMGCSNAEIAAELILAESTVKTHVSRILRKVRLRDRTQLARFAHENNIV